MIPIMSQAEPKARLLRACRSLPVDRTPVWLMRQAGRYQPEYRALRRRYSMLELLASPELAAEVTLLPLRSFDLDAAIIFSDILPPLGALGLGLEFTDGEGPRLERPIRRREDVEALPELSAAEALPATLEAIGLVRRELGGKVPLIGFAGAPFTLASYAIEGGGTRDFARTRALMAEDPATWHRLIAKLGRLAAELLLAQARAGAEVLQVFDSWVGALSEEDYRQKVEPHQRELLARVRAAGVPVIHFTTGTAGWLERVAAVGGDVVAVDASLPLAEAWKRIGHGRPIMGNLDPAALLEPWPVLREKIDRVLEGAAGQPGHVFNLGHGVLPQTPVEAVRQLVEHVHQSTAVLEVGRA